MKTITLNVDNESCRIYDELSQQNKKIFEEEVSQLLQKSAQASRSLRLKQLVKEINESDCSCMNADVLLELLPVD